VLNVGVRILNLRRLLILANCNECKNMDVIVETDELGKNMNHVCTKHCISVRYAGKRYKGYIWPCTECDSKDFESIKALVK